jgi:hypothetical protein
VGEERRREAVERVTVMQSTGTATGSGARPRHYWTLNTPAARSAEVAVPYGNCSEPSNVAASGQDCPLRFRCIGCGRDVLVSLARPDAAG